MPSHLTSRLTLQPASMQLTLYPHQPVKQTTLLLQGDLLDDHNVLRLIETGVAAAGAGPGL